MKIVFTPLWEIGLALFNVICFPVIMVDFSFMEIVFFPKCPLVLRGIIVGGLMSTA